jgi:hypothetical protein
MLVLPFDMAIYSLNTPTKDGSSPYLRSDPERGKIPSMAHNVGASALPSPASIIRALQAMGSTTPQISRIQQRGIIDIGAAAIGEAVIHGAVIHKAVIREALHPHVHAFQHRRARVHTPATLYPPRVPFPARCPHTGIVDVYRNDGQGPLARY